MAKRKAIPKKVRFEVFKRDKFTCQYCGAKAPDVVLQIDHIKPVAHDGENDIMNLVTACEDCNQGKGARELSDDSAVRVRREQAEILAERREQIEMMYEWQLELADQDDYSFRKTEEYIERLTGYELTDWGVEQVRKWLKTFGFDGVLTAARISFGKYGYSTEDEWEFSFKKIPGICYNRTHKSCSQCVNRTNYRYEDRMYLCDYHVDNTGHDDDPPLWHKGSVAEWCPDYESVFGGE